MWTFVSNKFNKMIKLILLLLSKKWIICFPFLFACGQPNTTQETEKGKQLARTLKEAERAKTVLDSGITLGNQRLAEYLPLLKGKQVGFVGNHTALIGESHLVDSLLNLGVDIVKVFSPEHGFRGIADAGEKIKDGIDPATKLPVFSLYGDQKKPTVKQMKDLDVLVFDLQDVGARFYTYISTLHYVMEATAENEIPLIVLDRPNPNAHYVDGPVLEENFQSFVGMHPVPIVHGMTIGEYAGMINGENWLKGGLKCKLHVVPCLSYNHQKPYNLELSPSPITFIHRFAFSKELQLVWVEELLNPFNKLELHGLSILIIALFLVPSRVPKPPNMKIKTAKGLILAIKMPNTTASMQN